MPISCAIKNQLTNCFKSRFTNSDYHVFTPTNETSQDPIQFCVPSIRSNGVYRLDQAILSLEIKLKKASNVNQNIPKAEKVAVANNAVNSLWSKSALYLNNGRNHLEFTFSID